MTGSELTGSGLTGSELTGSGLTGSELTGSELTGSELTGLELTGVWRLTAYFDIDDAGVTSEGPLGPDPRGLLYYAADGYMSVDMMRPDAPQGAVGYMGYAGFWRMSGNQMVHMIEVCSNPRWADTEQVRDMELDGDRLTLVGSAPVNGRDQRRILHWKRA